MPDVVAAPANAIPTALIAKLVLGGVVVAAAVVAGYFLMQTPTPVPAPSPPKYSPPTLIPPIPISPPVSGQPLQAMSTPFKDLSTHSKEPWCQCNKQPSQHTQQRQCSQCLPPQRPLHLWRRLRRPRLHRLRCPPRLLHPWRPRLLPHRRPLRSEIWQHGQKPSTLLMKNVGWTQTTTVSCVTPTCGRASSGRFASTWRHRQDSTCVVNKHHLDNVGSRRVTQ